MTIRQVIFAGMSGAVLLGGALPSAAEDRRVTIVNETGYTITHFYGSNKGSTSWQEDILGQSVLETGSSASINFNDGTGYCVFDFKAVFEDGDEVTQAGVNVCEIGTFTFN